jgi:hypothetical protein
MISEIKISVFIAIVFFFLNTRMFYATVLKKIPGTLEYDIPNEKGLAVSSFVMAIAFLLISVLVSNNFI